MLGGGGGVSVGAFGGSECLVGGPWRVAREGLGNVEGVW